MKKILLVLVVVLAGFAASAQKSAAVSSKSLETGKSTGKYLFAFPADITAKQVDDVKAYYKDYFTVGFNEMKHEATVTLTKNEEMNRRVILRFLSSLGMRNVNVEGTEKTLDEFYENNLK